MMSSTESFDAWLNALVVLFGLTKEQAVTSMPLTMSLEDICRRLCFAFAEGSSLDRKDAKLVQATKLPGQEPEVLPPIYIPGLRKRRHACDDTSVYRTGFPRPSGSDNFYYTELWTHLQNLLNVQQMGAKDLAWSDVFTDSAGADRSRCYVTN